MTPRERENRTLGFQKVEGGSVEETFYPWDITVQRFQEEGLYEEDLEHHNNLLDTPVMHKEIEKYFHVSWGEEVMKYESILGFDPVRRVDFILPFRKCEEKILEETEEYIIRLDESGKQMLRKKGADIETEYKPVIENMEEWEKLKEYSNQIMETYFTEEAIMKTYGQLKEKHDLGKYTIRFHIEGFFWTPRELMGIEQHLYGFYDKPELIHDINTYILEIYKTILVKIIKIAQPDVLYIMEDLSGKNGPMISKELFDEFVGAYYKEIIPLLKRAGTKYVFVDTDGDFTMMIPNFIESGVEGFLPMDVNAGMDIVKARNQFPKLKFIGGFNKLSIAEGKEAIDKEFERILPVIRGGGYIVGCDHQVAPSTSLDNYKYYISKLKEVMRQAGSDIKEGI